MAETTPFRAILETDDGSTAYVKIPLAGEYHSRSNRS